MGKVIVKSDYIHIEDEATLETAMRICKNYVKNITKQENYPIENPTMISMEMIETK